MLTVDTQEECISKLKAWKVGMESEGFHVNMKKTKFLVSGDGHDVLKKSVKYPCALCCSGVDGNSILFSQCMLWVCKKCSSITNQLVAHENYVCPRCKGESRHINGWTVTEVDVDGTVFDVEDTGGVWVGMLHRWYVPQNSTSYDFIEKQGSKLYIGQIAGKMWGQNYTLDKLLEKYEGRSYTS